MIRVISTLIIYRPKRVLFYLPEITDETKQCILSGTCPDAFKEYQHNFGTYDEPGIFYLSPDLEKQIGKKNVIGIEYRDNDSSLNTPKNLPSLELSASYYIIQDVDYKQNLSKEVIEQCIDFTKNQENERTPYFQYVDNGLVAVFSSKEKLRIIYEIKLKNEAEKFLGGTFEDFSKEDLYNKAFHDPITGFYNWTWMWECFNTISLSKVSDYGFVHFDIKDFNMINELYNHQVANELLVRITKNIEAHKDWIYFGARCDNDNFALMIKDMPEEETRQKLASFFDEISFLDADPSYQVFYRCGVVTMRYAMNFSNTVADYAKMAQATGTGIKNTEIIFFTEEMHQNVLWGKQLKAYLDTALRSEEFLVYLQPKMNIDKENLYGAEALIRWNYKSKGLIPPYKFIPYFEFDDSIIKVDEYVLRKICEKLQDWKAKGYNLYPISVNLSRKHMEQPNLANHLEKIVDSYGVDHSLIEFEITETATYDNQNYMISILHQLKEKGFLISMDDFGTGYSSFSLLEEMPLDTLKIDKSFVDLIATDKDSKKIQIILHHIISMAKELGIHCIAEGAEELAQVHALRDLGCNTIQGYFYSKPLPIETFEENYLQ